MGWCEELPRPGPATVRVRLRVFPAERPVAPGPPPRRHTPIGHSPPHPSGAAPPLPHACGDLGFPRARPETRRGLSRNRNVTRVLLRPDRRAALEILGQLSVA